MHRHEDSGAFALRFRGDLPTLPDIDEGVVVPNHHHFKIGLSSKTFRKKQRDAKRDGLFPGVTRSESAGICSAMPSIDDHHPCTIVHGRAGI